MTQFIRQYQDQINQICLDEGISYLAIFGSQSRNEAKPNSDVDLIVDFSNKISLLGLSKVALRFEDLFGKKVDLITERSIKPLLKSYINQDKQVIFYDKNRPRLYQRYS